METTYLFETDKHQALRRQIKRFAEREIAPSAHAWDEAGGFPRALFTKAGEAGLLGLGFDETFGGAGGDVTHAVVAGDEMIRSGHSVGTSASLGSLAIALPPIVHFGTAAQKERWLPPAFRGETIWALAITEPGAGSDVAGIATRAVRDGDHYVVSGAKTFITSGTRADFYTTAVRTGGEGHGGISLLVIPKDAPGFSVGRKLDKMGWWASDTAELFFDDCRVPVENLVGQENAGFLAIMTNFVTERLLLCCQAVAMSQLAYDEARQYAKERHAFKKPLMGFQVTRHKLADIASRIAAARAVTGELTTRLASGENNAGLAAMAKNATTDALMWVVDQAVQIHGGYGYMREVTVERLYRDARIYPIGGGTREVMNEVIARMEGY